MTDEVGSLEDAGSLGELYPVFTKARLTPGWNKKRRSLWREPVTGFRPMHWRYAEAARAMDLAGQWMSTEDAERRNLLTYNPVGDNEYDTVRTIVSAYQMIKPGEHARAHRHSPNALRLMLDGGEGVYTVVDGVRLAMRPGDVLLTPNWSWHSHLNEGASNAYWIDFLDVPLVQHLEPMFMEELPGGYQQVTSSPEPDASPLVFTSKAAEAALDGAAKLPGGGQRVILDTQRVIPTLSIEYLRLPAGTSLSGSRDTRNRIFAVATGRGTARLEDLDVAWSRGDLFCLPSWKRFEISSAEDALILEVSDEPTMRMLGFLRSEPAQAR